MVRVPGFFGDAGFHRESQEDAQVKIEPGEEASSEVGSTKTLLNKQDPRIDGVLGGTLSTEESGGWDEFAEGSATFGRHVHRLGQGADR
ncbi:hypothetical protein PInf_009783 [Phytophthora infestans]|nr:hypothetical protein PInf_009783 [Phytophthora infestans]